MVLKSLFAVIVIIVRLLVSVKVIAWLILRFTSTIPHPISEIENYIIIILLDIWVSSSATEIVIRKEEWFIFCRYLYRPRYYPEICNFIGLLFFGINIKPK